MDALEQAKKRAILTVDPDYVFNDVYFSADEGLTSASANHIATMANIFATERKQAVSGLCLWQTEVQVIGSDVKTITQVPHDCLSDIPQAVEDISKANALTAWLREAVKEREAAINHVNANGTGYWAVKLGWTIPTAPAKPTAPEVNFNDRKQVLGAGFTLKEHYRYVELLSTLAVYGEFIHDKGLLTRQRNRLADIRNHPTEVEKGGRDTIITTYQTVATDDQLNAVYAQLQAEYRKLQAEKNGSEAKWTRLAMNYQVAKKTEYDEQMRRYNHDCDAYRAAMQELESRVNDWKREECDRLASLKIVIPNAMRPVYERIKAKYGI